MSAIERVTKRGMESLLEEVPGAKTIHLVISEVVRARRERLGEQFLADVAVLVAANEVDQTNLAETLKEEWAAEAFERGHAAMMQATDPECRACIAALVALYLHDRRAPDREYKRIAALLAETTAEDLESLKRIGAGVLAMAVSLHGKFRPMSLCSREASEDAACIVSRGGGKVHRIAPIPVAHAARDLILMLTRHAIVDTHDGTKWGVGDEGNFSEFTEHARVATLKHFDTVSLMVQCIGQPSIAVPPVIVEEG